MSIPLKEQEKC